MKSKWWVGLITAVAFVTQMLVMWPSGSQYCKNQVCGDYYWGVHEHDAIWHLAIANTAFSSYPLQMPTFAGEELRGYNWLIDLPLYLLAKVGIPVGFTYFKLLPLAWFGLMIWCWKKLADYYQPASKWYWPWLLFWLFFGNSLSFILTLWHNQSLIGSSALLAMQPPMMLINLQFAFTLPILAAVSVLLEQKLPTSKHEIKLAGLLFVAMGLKFYGGAITFALIAIHSFIHKRYWRILIATGVTLATIMLIYQPKFGGESILAWQPLATVYPIIEEKTLFYIPKLAVARYSTEWGKQAIAAFAAIVIFVLFNFGGRLVGLMHLNKLSKFEISLWLTSIVALLANMLFVQRGEWWNTVQFLYYAFFLISILTAKVLASWNYGTWRARIGAMIIIATCIPNLVDTVRVFGQYPPGSMVSNAEKDVLYVLRELPKGIVLALPLARSESGSPSVPGPLYLRYETSYVAAYSGKVTYFNDTVQARLVGIDYDERNRNVRQGKCSVLDEVDYVYVAGDQSQIDMWTKCDKDLNIITQNKEASLYSTK